MNFIRWSKEADLRLEMQFTVFVGYVNYSSCLFNIVKSVIFSLKWTRICIPLSLVKFGAANIFQESLMKIDAKIRSPETINTWKSSWFKKISICSKPFYSDELNFTCINRYLVYIQRLKNIPACCFLRLYLCFFGGH